jgi:hypothetical protein
MSAVIELMEPVLHQVSLREVPREGPNVAKEFALYELPPEQRLNQVLEKLSKLEAENERLRAELWRQERESRQRNLLLRNARLREQALRAQLAAQFY